MTDSFIILSLFSLVNPGPYDNCVKYVAHHVGLQLIILFASGTSMPNKWRKRFEPENLTLCDVACIYSTPDIIMKIFKEAVAEKEWLGRLAQWDLVDLFHRKGIVQGYLLFDIDKSALKTDAEINDIGAPSTRWVNPKNPTTAPPKYMLSK